MPAKRILTATLALLMIAAIPARAASVPTLTVIDTIRPGAGESYAMDYSNSVALNGYLYFAARDGVIGVELWRTNGTTTELVKEILSGSNSSYPDHFTALGNYLYFTADDGTHGAELWRTDGTELGTTLVKDIYSGSNSSDLAYLTAMGNYLYFNANDGTNGFELWRTDGTTPGTTLIKDINTSGSSSPDSACPSAQH